MLWHVVKMDTTDFIAILALVTSVASLMYTIVVDRRRPKLQVTGAIIQIYDQSPIEVRQHGPYFNIRATNHGPGRVRVTGVCLTHRSRLRRLFRQYIKKDLKQGVVFVASPESPNKLPKWLEVGESLDLLYPGNAEMLQENDQFDCFYLNDSIGGKHWAQKRVFDMARKDLAQTK